MRQIKINDRDGKNPSIINVNAEASRIAREKCKSIKDALSSVYSRFGVGVAKVNISQEAIEDLITIHGADVVKGIEEDFYMDALMQASFAGSRAAYDELCEMPAGRVFIDRMKIKKPEKDGKRK